MSQTITLTVSDEAMKRAKRIAERSIRSMDEVLASWLVEPSIELLLDWMPDDLILMLYDYKLPAPQQTELSDLLYENQEGPLADAKRTRLDEMLDLVQGANFLKAFALVIAVKRGLKPPLSPQETVTNGSSIHSG